MGTSDWNKNYEANARTDRDVFRIFRDGATTANTYRKEPNNEWWLRSINNDYYLITVNYNGTLGANIAPNKCRVRPHRMHEMYMHLEMILAVHLAGMQIVKQMH